MKKRLVSIITAAVMVFSAIPSFAASNANDVLQIVLSKVAVKEYDEFEYSQDQYDGTDEYYFYWNNASYSQSCNISADTEGHIKNYGVYDDSFYTDGEKKIIKADEDTVIAVADEFVKKAIPEMFESDKDTLVLDKGAMSIYSNDTTKVFELCYNRYHNGRKMEDNDVSVSVVVTEDEYFVRNLSSSIDYNAVFDEGVATELGMDTYEQKFPITLCYKKVYDKDSEVVKPVYILEKGYVNEISGEIADKDYTASLFDEGMGANDSMSATGAMMSSRPLTEGEIAELENMDSIISQEEAVEKLKGIDELKIADDMKVSGVNKYKNGDSYSMNIQMDNDNQYLYARFNGVSGEILSISNNITSSKTEKLTDEQKAAAAEKAKAFIEKMVGDNAEKMNFDTNGSQAVATRVVNGIEYVDNYIDAMYDLTDDMITEYGVYWDDDSVVIPSIEGVLDGEAALNAALSLTGLEHVWIKSNDKYVPTLTIGQGVTIDAFSGKNAYNYYDEKPEYTDIDGHWAEEIIKTLLSENIYLDGETFRPDESITQEDFFKYVGSLFYYDSFARNDVNYDNLINSRGVLKEDEADKTAQITKEQGYTFFVRMMGAGAVSELDIFKTTFDDAADFTLPEGSAEILKGMNVIEGNMAEPQGKLTRAETARMIYNYLTR